MVSCFKRLARGILGVGDAARGTRSARQPCGATQTGSRRPADGTCAVRTRDRRGIETLMDDPPRGRWHADGGVRARTCARAALSATRQIVELVRLADVRMKTGREAARPIFVRGVRGQRDRGGDSAGRRIEPTNPVQHLKSVHVRHREIAEQHIARIELPRADGLAGRGAVLTSAPASVRAARTTSRLSGSSSTARIRTPDHRCWFDRTRGRVAVVEGDVRLPRR